MVNLTPQDTVRLIAKMRALYGRKFDQQWSGVDPRCSLKPSQVAYRV